LASTDKLARTKRQYNKTY